MTRTRGDPWKLYGIAVRNGFEEFGWPDGATLRPHPVLSAGSAFGSARRATRHVFAADALGNDAFTLINGDLILRSGDQLYRIAVDGTSAQRE